MLSRKEEICIRHEKNSILSFMNRGDLFIKSANIFDYSLTHKILVDWDFRIKKVPANYIMLIRKMSV